MSDDRPWTEDDSGELIDPGRYIVPDREEQPAISCRLVPSGDGLLAEVLLERHASVTVHGLDRSEMTEAGFAGWRTG